MIFADKLIKLRKKNGWSQEELAEQMNVTRQSVSKWEGAQSVPDIEKMIKLSNLFEVSIDYLLKDEIEEEEQIEVLENTSPIRRVSMEEASKFLDIKKKTSKSIAYATFLCILSPIALLILGAISESSQYSLKENVAGGVGVIILLGIVTIATVIFISSGNKTAEFEYIEKDVFETEYGVDGMVKKRKEEYKDIYNRNNIIGVCICITSVIPLFVGAIINEENDLFLTSMLCITLIIVGIGVVFLISSGIIWESFEKLLQERDYTKEKKKNGSLMEPISTIYWLITTAIYLGYSFYTNNWGYSWIIWVVASILYPIINIIGGFLAKENNIK